MARHDRRRAARHRPGRIAASESLGHLDGRVQRSMEIYGASRSARGCWSRPRPGARKSLSRFKRRIEATGGERTTGADADQYDVQKEKSTPNAEGDVLGQEVDTLKGHIRTGRAEDQRLKFERSEELGPRFEAGSALDPEDPFEQQEIGAWRSCPWGCCSAWSGFSCCWRSRPNESETPTCCRAGPVQEVAPAAAVEPGPPSCPGPLDDQIDRFIQRLDHLRFAVCGGHHDTDLGRCVLVTSAVGGEGKTTLSAQLAARCGNAGISTLLIDADLRRGALCPLLDVPEGPGLSDAPPERNQCRRIGDPRAGGHTPSSDVGRRSRIPARPPRRFRRADRTLRHRYEMIIIGSRPAHPRRTRPRPVDDGALLASRSRSVDHPGRPLAGGSIKPAFPFFGPCSTASSLPTRVTGLCLRLGTIFSVFSTGTDRPREWKSSMDSGRSMLRASRGSRQPHGDGVCAAGRLAARCRLPSADDAACPCRRRRASSIQRPAITSSSSCPPSRRSHDALVSTAGDRRDTHSGP